MTTAGAASDTSFIAFSFRRLRPRLVARPVAISRAMSRHIG